MIAIIHLCFPSIPHHHIRIPRVALWAFAIQSPKDLLMNLQQFSLILIGIIVLIILYNLIGNFFEHRHIHVLHETGIGILIGFAFGGLLYLLGDITQINFDEEIFFYALLPPMIFAGGYNLKKKDFGKNFKYILIYGLVGTIVSFGVIFGLTYAINKLHWIVPFRTERHIEQLETSLIVKYSATISATDSVAALTLIKASEFPKIFSIIFGEGMVNDAVAIILFKVVGGIFDKIQQQGMTVSETMKQIIGSFFGTVIYSVLIGILSAIVCSFIFRKFRFLVETEVTQVVITYLFGILSYVAAEYYDLSGVITVLICGVVLAHYNFYNLTVGGMHATAITFQSISFIAEAIVFVYLGVSTIYYLTTEVISFTFIALQLLVCVISRLTAIFGLSMLFKLFYKSKWTVTNSELSIVSIAGTIRGSVAFALILTIQSNDQTKDEVSVIKSTTLIMVCLTTIVLGGLMPKFIKCFLGSGGDNQPIPHENLDSLRTEDTIKRSEGQEPLIQFIEEVDEIEKKKNKKPGFFKYSDQNYWRPFLIWNYAERKQQINTYKKMMKYNSRGEYQGGNFNALVMRNVGETKLDEFVSEVEQKDKQKHISNILKKHDDSDDDGES